MSNPRPCRRLGLLSAGWLVASCMLAGCSAVVPRYLGMGRVERPEPEPDPKLPEPFEPATPRLDVSETPVAAPTATPPASKILDEAVKLAKDEAAAVVSEVASPAAQDPAPSPTPVATVPAELPPKPEIEPSQTPAPAPPPPTPEESWRNHLRALREIAAAKSATASAIEPGIDWKLRERLLGWMLEPDIDPDAASPNEKTPWRSVLLGLGFLTEPRRTPPSETSAILRAAIEALENEAPLEIQDLRLCRKVSGYGSFDAIDPPEFKQGGIVVIYRELVGVRPEPVANGLRTRIASQIEVIPEGGATPVWSGSLGSAEDVCGKRRRDYYVNSRFTIPASLNPGDYRLRLIETDLVAKSSASLEIPIKIAASSR